MVKNGQNGQNGLKWSKMVPNDPTWSNIVQNGTKLSKLPKMDKIGQNGLKWSKVVQSGPKWSQMVPTSSSAIKRWQLWHFLCPSQPPQSLVSWQSNDKRWKLDENWWQLTNHKIEIDQDIFVEFVQGKHVYTWRCILFCPLAEGSASADIFLSKLKSNSLICLDTGESSVISFFNFCEGKWWRIVFCCRQFCIWGWGGK